MGWLDPLWDLFGTRSSARADAVPELPGPVDSPALASAPEVATAADVVDLPAPTPPSTVRYPRLVEVEARRWDASIHNEQTGLGGGYDKSAVARPNREPLLLDEDELAGLFVANAPARRIVRLLPSRATRRGWTAPEMEEEERRLRLYEKFRDGFTWAQLWGGSGVLMVTEDDVPTAFRRRPADWLREPIDLERVGRIVAMHALDVYKATPMTYETSLLSPDYGAPALWSVNTEDFSGVVHASRIIWLRGERQPSIWRQRSGSRMPDMSVLQALWDEIRRLCETMAGGAVLAQELRTKVFKIKGLAAKKTAADERDAFMRRLTQTVRSQSVVGATIMDSEDSFESSSNAPTGFEALSEAALDMLCLGLGWPRTMLTGEAPGGLSTDDKSGKERERAVVSAYQEDNREPVERAYKILYAQQDGPTGGEEPEGWRIEFLPLDEPTEKEKAELRLLVAQTDAIYVQMGAIGPRDVCVSRFGEDGYNFDLQPVEPPDEDVEEMVLRALAARAGGDPAAAGGDPPEGGGDPTRGGGDPDDEDAGESEEDQDQDEDEDRDDASERSCLVWIPAADPGLRAAVETAIGQSITTEHEPHVTVLYLGDLPAEDLAEAQAEVAAAVAEVAADTESTTLRHGTVRTFAPNSHGVPIVVEFEAAWSLAHANEALLRALAHRVQAKQHRRFRPHLTIGYAREPLSPEALTALAAVDANEVRVPVAALVARIGQRTIAAAQVGG